MPDGSPPRPLVARLALIGSLAGASAAAIGLAASSRLAATPNPPELLYAVLVSVLTGLAGGFLAGCIGAVAQRAAGPARPINAAIIGSLLPIAAFVWLNLDLFAGNWVRQQSWAGAATWGFRAAGAIAIVIALLGLRRLAASSLLYRAPAIILAFSGAMLAARGHLTLFGAYPLLKLQLAALVGIAAGIGWWLLLDRLPSFARAEAILAVLIVAGAIGAGIHERHRDDINSIRGTIIGTPVPFAADALTAAEYALAPLSPVAAPKRPPAAADASIEPAFDMREVSRMLDERLPARRKFNVLWIAIDALRADHLGCQGYDRPTSPNMDAFARQSQWFRRAVSPVPASSMGYSSLMTGLFARVTPAYAAEFGVKFPVPKEFSVPERFRAAGRHTFAVTAFYKTVQDQPQFAISKAGFEVVNPVPHTDELRANEVTDQGIDLLSQAAQADRPFFAWLHYMEPHAPYYFHPEHDFGRLPRDVYDGEIAYADDHFGRLLAAIKRLGLEDNTVIILFGDHGEGFGEHNNREHGASLHDHQVRVPLMMRIPGLAPHAFDQWVSLADVPRTTMALAGVGDPFTRLGRDLTPLIAGAKGSWPDVVYAERTSNAKRWPRSWERAVWSGDQKLIWKPHNSTWQVYDLAHDPGELTDVFREGDPAHQHLLAMLEEFDRKIDTYWEGGTPSAPASATSLSRQFAAIVDRLLAADDAARPAIMAELWKMVESPAIEQERPRRALLGMPSLARVAAFVAQKMPTIPVDAPDYLLMARFLIFWDDPQLLPLLRTECQRMPAVEARFIATVYLAERGVKETAPELTVAFQNGLIEDRITAAGGLAALGDASGRDLLHMALDIEWHPGIVRRAVDGLGRLGDPLPIERMLLSWRAIWTNPWVQRGLVEAAKALPPSPTSNAALLMLMNGADDIAGPAARAEFEKRLTPTERAHATRVFEALVGARTALMYFDPVTAVASFKEIGPADDRIVGLGWWLLVRAGREAGNVAEAQRGLDRLKAVLPNDPATALNLERLASGISVRPESAPALAGDLRAELKGPASLPILSIARMFHAHVEITNRSGHYIPGGESYGAPRLQWRFAAGGTLLPVARSIVAELPWGGLRPNETAGIDLLGILPEEAGVYSGRIIWQPLLRDEGEPVTLLEQPPLPIK